MGNQIVETWEINNRIDLYLLDAVAEADLPAIASSKGRTVGEQFAHIHNVRLMWLQQGNPDLLNGIEKIEKEKINKKYLAAQLIKSGKAIATMIETALEQNKLKGFKPHPTAFLGYIIAHEAHHRGQIILSLKQSGKPVDKKVLFGIWEWGTK